MVPGEHFPLEDLKVLPVDVVLPFAPRRPALLVLQTPVDGEEGRQHLELVAGDEHLVDLRGGESKEELIF